MAVNYHSLLAFQFSLVTHFLQYVPRESNARVQSLSDSSLNFSHPIFAGPKVSHSSRHTVTLTVWTHLKCPVWYATIALARSTASERSNSEMFGWATGRLHRNRASRSISPESSSVSQTVATCDAVKFNVGKANSGLGAKIGCGWTGACGGFPDPPVGGPTAIDGCLTTARLFVFGAILNQWWRCCISL